MKVQAIQFIYYISDHPNVLFYCINIDHIVSLFEMKNPEYFWAGTCPHMWHCLYVCHKILQEMKNDNIKTSPTLSNGVIGKSLITPC